jgi:hypothetical protein
MNIQQFTFSSSSSSFFFYFFSFRYVAGGHDYEQPVDGEIDADAYVAPVALGGEYITVDDSDLAGDGPVVAVASTTFAEDYDAMLPPAIKLPASDNEYEVPIDEMADMPASPIKKKVGEQNLKRKKGKEKEKKKKGRKKKWKKRKGKEEINRK